MAAQQLGLVDYAVFATLLALPQVVGVVMSCATGCRRSYNEFLFGAGLLKPVPVALSLMLPLLSSTALMEAPDAIATRGFMTVFQPAGAVAGFFLSALTALQVVLPLRFLSLNEYLRQRFRSPPVALVGTCLVLLAASLGLAAGLDGPVRLVTELSGGVIPRHFALVLVVGNGLVCAICGGLRAVVWSCLVQVVTYTLGLGLLLLFTQIDAGGPVATLLTNLEHGFVHLPVYTPDPRVRDTVWGLLVGAAVHWLLAGVAPQSIQRMRSLSSLPEARLAFCVAGLGVLLFWCLGNICGLGLFAVYADALCNVTGAAAANVTVPRGPGLVSHYVAQRLTIPGFKGLFLAAVCSGAISAITAGVSAFVAMVWEDLVQSFSFWSASRGKTTTIGTVLSVLFGAMLTLLAYLFVSYDGAFVETGMAITGAAAGAYVGTVVLAFFCPQINNGFIGIAPLAGFAVSLWQGLGSVSTGIGAVPAPALLGNGTASCLGRRLAQRTAIDWHRLDQGLAPFYAIAPVWLASIGLVVTAVLGVIVGRLTSSPKRVTDKEYVLCACCRCCRACRADSEMEDGMEDFDWMPHDTVCPVHSRSNLAVRMDDTLRSPEETVPLNPERGSDSAAPNAVDGLLYVTVDIQRPESPQEPAPVHEVDPPTLQVNGRAAVEPEDRR